MRAKDGVSRLIVGMTDQTERESLMPYASTLISVLRATLKTMERSPEVPPDSPALQRLRDGVEAMVAELEPAATKEPKFELRTGPDLYLRDSREA